MSDTAPTTYGTGGGILNQGTLLVSASSLNGNTASISGAIASTGTLMLISSSVTTNTSTLPLCCLGTGGGGGVYTSGTATVISCSLRGNTATYGGGIDNSGALAVTNSTVTYSTLSGNSAPSGAGILHDFGTLTLTGTMVANNTGGPNCSGGITEVQGYNLDSDGSCGFSQSTDLTHTNPLLGPLTNNGGPTPTMALLPTSPAIDHGGTSANGCPATDQRSVTRPQGPACDIGAYEANEAAPATGFLEVCKNVNGPISAAATVTFTVDDGSYHTTVNLTLPASATGASVCTPLAVFNGIPAGQATITEQTLPGWALASVDVFPPANQVSTDLTTRTAVVTIVGASSSQTQTDVVFTNAPTGLATP